MNRSFRPLHVAASAAVLLACVLPGAWANDGAYVGVEGGINWETPQDLRQNGVVTDRIHLNRGWAAGLVGGWSFANGFRPELELDHRRNDLNHDFFGRQDGSDNADSALANLWYDYKSPTGWLSTVHPYIGIGAGAVRSYDRKATLGAFELSDNYSTEFGYQAGAGVGYDVTPHLTLSLDYRYLWTNRSEFHPPVGIPLSPFYSVEQRYGAQTAMLSVRYTFAARAVAPGAQPLPPPPEPAATPEPAPPPSAPPAAAAPPCIPPVGFQVDANCHIIDQTIVVRAVDFKTNSSLLTDPAQQTLNQVAGTLSTQPALRVEIQGYTDSTGPDAYNLKLSQQRADAVMDYLVGKGVTGASLTARGYGKADPLTSNDTREGRAQNRRVSFEISHSPEHVKVDSEQATAASTEAAEQAVQSKSRD